MKKTILLVVAILALTLSSAQAQTALRSTSDTVSANPKDVATLDAVVASLYDVISGGAGQKRDWNRMRSLFLPGGRLIATGKNKDGVFVQRTMTVEEYISRSAPNMEKDGFFERETARTQETFGNIVHLFSTYEGRRAATDEKPFVRGINSIQAWNDGKRWWIVTVFWQPESPESPLPARYLPGARK